jgi:hypothetical protein
VSFIVEHIEPKGMFPVTSAKVESHTADLGTPKKHLSLTEQDNHAKVAQQIALPESVESETPLVAVHSETSKLEDNNENLLAEDNNENLLAASGTPGRVVQAFTLLHANPEAQVVSLILCPPLCLFLSRVIIISFTCIYSFHELSVLSPTNGIFVL